ncbi:MAG: hypothetical protein Q8Q96_00275, partial [bacterium]|nr:hypothetical protein [bacterium]
KMSSSKGVGLDGEDLLKILPSEIIRFLMIKTEPNHAVEFSPFGTDTIPNLYDEYQKAVEEKSRVFEVSQVEKINNPPKIRFSVLAQWVQMPNMEETIKKEGLEEWAKYARVWLDKYAPDEEKFVVQKELPPAAKGLSEKQKKFLRRISSELGKNWEAEEFQKNLYEWVKELGLPSKDAFSAIYLSLIGKDHGPKAAWLILSLDKEFVKKRFGEVSG